MKLRIEFRDNRTAFKPGAELTGTVGWEGISQPRKAQLTLSWMTKGKGTEDSAVVQTIIFDHPKERESRPFTLRPVQSPFSFSGKLISIIWTAELTLQPGDLSERVEIIVAPDAREITVPIDAFAWGASKRR